MSLPIIEVENIRKTYQLGAIGATTLRNSLTDWWQRRRKQLPPRSNETFVALDDVSFSVQPGEVLAIIGRNGAGKSTLLKLLSRITAPTSGRAVLRGRVASLLEVGTGFHPDLTGRENIFLNGAILGMTRAEILRKFDEIVAFADVQQFLDTPVKRYSSGMYVRLAFAVAAHLEPEILIVDEVLAVGDAAFQQKCLGKMQSIASGLGRTVLFVSHNMQAVSTFCNRGLLLERGKVQGIGTAREMADKYLGSLHSTALPTVWRGESGDGTFVLRCARVLGGNGNAFLTDQPLRLQVVGEVLQPIFGLICSVEVHSASQQILVYSSYDDTLPPPPVQTEPGPFCWELTIPANTFASGSYRLRLDIYIHFVRQLIDEVVNFQVNFENLNGIGRRVHTPWHSCLRPDWPWRQLSEREATDILAEKP